MFGLWKRDERQTHLTSGGLVLLSPGETEPILIIPAAGIGSRLQAKQPKFLVRVNGRPMIDRLIDLYRPYVSRIILVVSPESAGDARSRAAASDIPIEIAIQQQPTGMLDAVLLAYDQVNKSRATRVWITWCDQIAIHPRTVARLSELSTVHAQAPIVMPVAFRKNPYIHLERNGGRIVRVLHQREGDTMPDVGESDAGLFSFSREAYLARLPEYSVSLDVGSATRERNLLPFIPWIAEWGDIVVFPCVDEIEAVGINTPEELTAVEAHLAKRQHRVLSIVIPAYNEERFIGTLLDRIKAVDLTPLGLDKEIIVVDDCSRDRTGEIVQGHEGVKLHRMERNGGKGAAVRAGIAAATGDYLIIQDADLEYDPNDYVAMLEALFEGQGDVVYGSRYLGRGKHASQSWTAYLGGRSLSVAALACTGRYLTDTVTALKLFARADIAALPLESSGFELDHEITSRMAARGKRIVEVPISYSPRSREEGKKIGLRDWFIGIRTFWRYGRKA
jgi:CTP:molybdopterin cytidylyltransferase MocA